MANGEGTVVALKWGFTPTASLLLQKFTARPMVARRTLRVRLSLGRSPAENAAGRADSRK